MFKIVLAATQPGTGHADPIPQEAAEAARSKPGAVISVFFRQRQVRRPLLVAGGTLDQLDLITNDRFLAHVVPVVKLTPSPERTVAAGCPVCPKRPARRPPGRCPYGMAGANRVRCVMNSIGRLQTASRSGPSGWRR